MLRPPSYSFRRSGFEYAPDAVSEHTTRELCRRAGSAPRAGAARRCSGCGRAPAIEGQAARARAHRGAARPGVVRGAGRVCPASQPQLRDDGEPAVRRRRGHRARHGRGSTGVCVLARLHCLRRLPGRSLCGEDRESHGHGDPLRLSHRRNQRFRRGADPGGRRLPGRLRRHLHPQRARLRRDPADLAGDGAVRRWRGVFTCNHGLRDDGRGDLAHVHHRARGREDRHRRGRELRGTRRRHHPRNPLRRRPLHRARRACADLGLPLPALVPAPVERRAAAVGAALRPGRSRGRRARPADSRRGRPARTTCTR